MNSWRELSPGWIILSIYGNLEPVSWHSLLATLLTNGNKTYECVLCDCTDLCDYKKNVASVDSEIASLTNQASNNHKTRRYKELTEPKVIIYSHMETLTKLFWCKKSFTLLFLDEMNIWYLNSKCLKRYTFICFFKTDLTSRVCKSTLLLFSHQLSWKGQRALRP